MKKLAALTLSMFLVYGTAFADSPKNADPRPAKAAQPAKPKAASKADKSDSAIAAEIAELRQALQSQQEELQLLKEELFKRDHQIDAAREAAAAANARAAEASTKATEAVNITAEVKSAAVSLNSSVSDLRTSNEALRTTVATEQAAAKKAAEDGPSTIKFKGISLTPGGFIAAESVFRSRATSADVNTPFTAIPFPSQALGKVSENNFSGRQSRATLLAETKVGNAKVTGYYEADFLGSSINSNNRQSNSYAFRQRQLWASVAWDNGFSVSGGQMWSLVTENKKGIVNRQEVFPLQIDAQYVVGWSWQRAYGFRVVRNWDKFGLGFAIEGPQTTIAGRGFPANFFINAPGNGGGLFNAFDGAGYTLNSAPDFLVKATYDPGWGHYEVVGILSTFRNRIYPCGATPLPASCASATSITGAFNDTRTGGGVGFTARLPIVAKKADLVGHFQGGDGIGRYTSAQLADVTARPDGTLAPIRTAAWLGMLEIHPNPKVDLYAYGGGEYAARTAYLATPSKAVGYGSRFFNNSGCSTEALPAGGGPSGSGFPSGGGACAGDIHQIVEGTLGFWHKLYNGPKGRVQWGMQYSYITKVGWSGNNFNFTTGVAGPSLRPKAVDNMFFTSFRYYLP